MRCIYNGLVAGGMALQGNSWSCSCENVWLGRWLRRWMREALQLHTSVVERGQVITSGVPCIYFFIQWKYFQTIRAVVRTITCKNSDGSERPLVELDRDTPCSLALGVSSAPLQLAGHLVTRFVLFSFVALLTMLWWSEEISWPFSWSHLWNPLIVIHHCDEIWNQLKTVMWWRGNQN